MIYERVKIIFLLSQRAKQKHFGLNVFHVFNIIYTYILNYVSKLHSKLCISDYISIENMHSIMTNGKIL